MRISSKESQSALSPRSTAFSIQVEFRHDPLGQVTAADALALVESVRTVVVGLSPLMVR